MEKPKDTAQLRQMLQVVSSKLGIPADTLRQELESGKFDQAIAGLGQQDAAKFRQILANPQKLNQVMSSKQAKALYERLSKGG
ncbi:MAG: hypothetical protein MJ065_09815 [Oscillospiraceae bacterium]|nr:hypothetical protein [Oscillospiraceae bacterium]